MTIDDELRWYCLRTLPRKENLSVGFLRGEVGAEVFCPFVRFKRGYSNGPRWIREPLFPCYLFARFRYLTQWRHICATRGVVRIVRFGEQPAIVDEHIIHDLREAVKEEETIEITQELKPGEEVNIIAGPYRGVRAVISRVLPAAQRVAILLEILGSEREVEIRADELLPDFIHPVKAR